MAATIVDTLLDAGGGGRASHQLYILNLMAIWKQSPQAVRLSGKVTLTRTQSGLSHIAGKYQNIYDMI